MRIEILNETHIDDAAGLVENGYEEERKAVSILPFHESCGEVFRNGIERLIRKGMGVAALKSGRLVGFLAMMGVDSFKGLNRGAYSPVYGHAAVSDGKRDIYQRMYETLGDILVKNGCLTHAITLFAHDREAVDTLFWSGFGLRCVDAIRPVTPFETKAPIPYDIRMITADEAGIILPLQQEHAKYYSRSPLFMCVFRVPDLEDIVNLLTREGRMMWVAFQDGKPVGYIEVRAGGETFVSDDPKMLNICGAYSLESIRGSGASTALLSRLLEWMREEGYKRLGVDFESFNRLGSRFWLRYFEPFTYSLFRRLDERILWAHGERMDGIVF